MDDRELRKDPSRKDMKPGRWALYFLGCAMLPVIMFPGNLGPIAIVAGAVFYGLPAMAAGFILGLIFRASAFLNQLILTLSGIGVLVFMFDKVGAY